MWNVLDANVSNIGYHKTSQENNHPLAWITEDKEHRIKLVTELQKSTSATLF